MADKLILKISMLVAALYSRPNNLIFGLLYAYSPFHKLPAILFSVQYENSGHSYYLSVSPLI